jgi:hypothetical protein
MTCSCGFPFADGDLFCQNCGTRRVLPAGRVTSPPTLPPTMPPPVPPVPRARETPRAAAPAPHRAAGSWARLGAPYFTHATARPPEPMSNATRYLCAAAYLDPSFTNGVIREIVASHRAVIPSRGIDLVPVIRHCLKARRMRLTRDALLCGLLVFGVIVARTPLVLILVLTFLLGFLPGAQWERRSIGVKALIGVAIALAVILLMIVILVEGLFYALPYGLALDAGSAFLGLVYAGVIAAILYYHCYYRNRTLGEWLSPGTEPPPFQQSSPRVENRLAEVNAAQYGNLTLYSGEDPFLGSGHPPFKWRKPDERVGVGGHTGTGGRTGTGERAWSICIELSREGARNDIFSPEPRGRVRVDPVELHAVLRKRLLELNDPALPENERISALSVDDHVVGEGRFRWDSPLVDVKRLIPYSQVRPEAIPALIRNPQARLRYYQRVSISDEGQTVLTEDQPVIGSVDQEVVVSAFVYAAVEGHMFYLQFVPTSLAPIGDPYHVIDHMPRVSSGRFMFKTTLDAARGSFRGLLGSPLSLIWTLWLMYKEYRSFSAGLKHPQDYVYADIGAKISVRQFASRLWPRTYIQQLDVSKYTQIVERLVLDAVLDFLVAKRVDVTAYRAAAQAIYNSGTIVGGDVRNSNLTSNSG